MDEMKTWRALISEEMKAHSEKWTDVVSCTLSDRELDREFNAGYGLPKGKPFTLWTKKRVYVPTCYDGAEAVASAARDPDGKPTEHIGGY